MPRRAKPAPEPTEYMFEARAARIADRAPPREPGGPQSWRAQCDLARRDLALAYQAGLRDGRAAGVEECQKALSKVGRGIP